MADTPDNKERDDFKACPFCGSTAVTIGYAGQPAQSFHIACIGCGACGPKVNSASLAGGGIPSDIAARWSSRAPAIGAGGSQVNNVPELPKTWQERTKATMPWAMEQDQWDLHRAKDAEIADLRNVVTNLRAHLAAARQVGKHLFDAVAESAGAQPADRAEAEPSPLYFDAVKIVKQHQHASVSLVQRRLGIGWNDARNMVEMMLSRGDVPLEWAPPVYQQHFAAPSPTQSRAQPQGESGG